MPFCPLCHKNHPSNTNCLDLADQILVESGLKKEKKGTYMISKKTYFFVGLITLLLILILIYYGL